MIKYFAFISPQIFIISKYIMDTFINWDFNISNVVNENYKDYSINRVNIKKRKIYGKRKIARNLENNFINSSVLQPSENIKSDNNFHRQEYIYQSLLSQFEKNN